MKKFILFEFNGHIFLYVHYLHETSISCKYVIAVSTKTEVVSDDFTRQGLVWSKFIHF